MAVEEILSALRRALEPERVREAMERARLAPRWGGHDIQEVRIERLFPMDETRFVIRYRVRMTAAPEAVLFGELAPGDAAARSEALRTRLRKARRGQLPKAGADTGAVTPLPALQLVLVRPGYDPKLPGLVLHHQPSRRRRYLQALGLPVHGEVRSRILNHRLGKRCILALDDGREGVVVRCLKAHGDKHRANRHRLEALWRAGLNPDGAHGVRVPRLLATDDALAAVVLERIPGPTLEAHPGPAAERARLAARAIAALHRLQLPLEADYGVHDELAMLARWCALVAALRPPLAAALTQAMERVRRRLGALHSGSSAPVHRDFYDKQILLPPDGGLVLIDFDTLCRADPCLDLGNHLAHRDLAGDRRQAAHEAAAFLDAYRAHDLPAPAERVQAWTDAARLRLACLWAVADLDLARRLLAAIR